MKSSGLLLSLISAILPTLVSTTVAQGPEPIVPAVNELGLDLYREQVKTGDGNLLLSPYSIATALGMTYAGADGETKTEMQTVLHLPADADEAAKGFGALSKRLADMTSESK